MSQITALLIVQSISHVLNLECSTWIVSLDTMIFLKKDNILKQNVIYFINHNFKKTPLISFIAMYSKKEK